jgi:glycosyltransferase involved in cell wall biosynthesis
MVAVADLRGSGGSERYFADLFGYFRGLQGVDAYFVTARSSLPAFRAIGRLAFPDRVIALPLGSKPARGRLRVLWMTLALLWTTWGRRFDLVHVCLPTPSYVPYAALLALVPSRLRPRLTVSVIDCTVAANLEHGVPADRYERQVLDAHRLWAKWTRPDGVFSWYRAFVRVAEERRLFRSGPVISAAKYCFADLERLKPSAHKENVVVFAGRLSQQKRPLLFVDAVAEFCAHYPELAKDWRFEMYGRGELEDQVRGRIAERQLQNRVRLSYAADMSQVFATSRVYVSTQAIDNFTSLAMLEAMAAGNAVIAADVGQTSEFVRQGINGWLAERETPAAFAGALAAYMRQPQRHDAIAAASRAIAVTEHTVERAADDIIAFWQDVSGNHS